MCVLDYKCSFFFFLFHLGHLLCALKPESIFSTLKCKAFLNSTAFQRQVFILVSAVSCLFVRKRWGGSLDFTILSHIKHEKTNLSCIKKKKVFHAIPLGL